MKKITSLLAIAVATILSSKAATVTLSPGFGTGLIPTSGDNTSVVAVGGYVDGFVFAGASVTDLVSNFQVFASGQVTGRVQGDYTGINPAFNNDDIYVFVGDGTTLANSANIAIFRTTSNFVANVADAGGSLINVADTAFIEAGIAGSAAGNTITLVPVPEPSAVLLGGLGVLGLLRRRRR